MKRLRKKLRSSRGETLVELLAAILVSVLSVGLLLGGVAVSNRIERQAEASDQTFYNTLSAAESRTDPAETATVKVAEGTKDIPAIPVEVYGGEGLWSYALAGGDGS